MPAAVLAPRARLSPPSPRPARAGARVCVRLAPAPRCSQSPSAARRSARTARSRSRTRASGAAPSSSECLLARAAGRCDSLRWRGSFSGGRDRRSQRRVRREHAMKSRQMYPRRRHQRRQSGDKVQRLKHNMRRPVAIRSLQRTCPCAVRSSYTNPRVQRKPRVLRDAFSLLFLPRRSATKTPSAPPAGPPPHGT